IFGGSNSEELIHVNSLTTVKCVNRFGNTNKSLITFHEIDEFLGLTIVAMYDPWDYESLKYYLPLSNKGYREVINQLVDLSIFDKYLVEIIFDYCYLFSRSLKK